MCVCVCVCVCFGRKERGNSHLAAHHRDVACDSAHRANSWTVCISLIRFRASDLLCGLKNAPMPNECLLLFHADAARRRGSRNSATGASRYLCCGGHVMRMIGGCSRDDVNSDGGEVVMEVVMVVTKIE